MTSAQHTAEPEHDAAGQLRPLLMTVTQAAELLSIGRTHVYQLFWNAELTPIHIGRNVRISAAQLETFVNERLDRMCSTRKF